MLLNSLSLRDFGTYRGEQHLDLAPRGRNRRKPIVLVGGHNGAGKTTILDGLRLCLYGRLALGHRITDRKYHEYLRSMVHRDPTALIQASAASVSVSFEYARGGKTSNYVVERSWEVAPSSGKVAERLDILCDGNRLEEVGAQHWEDFVRSLIPPGVSQLFFFDGEQIKRLAEEATEAQTLAESVKALLGLDLVERLGADLDLYVSREVRHSGRREDVQRLEDIDAHRARLVSEEGALRDKAGALQSELESASEAVAALERQLSQAGAGLADQRGNLRQVTKELEVRIDVEERRIRELCEGALPFAWCRDLASTLTEQLEAEERLEKWSASRHDVRAALEEAEARILRTGAKVAALTGKAREHVQTELTSLLTRNDRIPEKLAGVTVIHGVSDFERRNIVRTIATEAASASGEAAKHVAALEHLTQELHTAKGQLNQAPADDELAPIVLGLSEKQAVVANVRAELNRVEAQLAGLTNQQRALEREQRKVEAAHAANAAMAQRVALAGKVRGALDEYLGELMAAKIKELEGEIHRCFEQLARKTDLVGDIRIDPATFGVSLFDKKSRPLPKEQLSAGEKQIYAISLLWALARVSGRPLPMVIDTPLGRLDSIHRDKLIQHYLPVAAHQVVILSTDTEVDRKYFDALRPHTSHPLRLVNEDGATLVRPGYFWKEEERASAHV